MRIINAQIFTMEGQVFSPGYVEFEAGKIVKVGSMAEIVPAPDDADALGGQLYPGFIDAHTHIGMWEDGLGFEGDDGNEDTDPVTPQLRAIDAVNPADRCFLEAARAGVTTVLTGPGSANPVGGQIAAMKTVGSGIDDMIIDPYCALKCALGENPKSTYHDKNQSPVTRMATVALIRELFLKAQRYAQECERAAEDEEYDRPDFDMKCEAVLPVLRGEKPVHFHAHRADDIQSAIRIAKEFSLRYVIVHGTEGYRIAGQLAKEGTRVLCGPVICERCKPELAGLTPANAGILSGAGVPVAIITDHPAVPVQYLTVSAGLCVRERLARDEALRAVTVTAAELCGIADRVGSIAPGKDADFVLFSEDPLLLSAKPTAVWVNGRRVQLENGEML